MAHLTPDEARRVCETALRQLLSVVMTAKLGADWLVQTTEPGRITRWTRRRDNERTYRESSGVAVVPIDPLAYSDFPELIDLVKDNWEDLEEALGQKNITGALLDRAVKLRNLTAHSRDLLPFEQDLLAGIAGEIRNRVTLFMTDQDPAGVHYARIEEIVDSFGNRLDGIQTLSDSNPCVICPQRLNPGDIVTFTCHGSDTQGRPLSWRLTGTPGQWQPVQAEGDRVQLRWKVGLDHVSEGTYVHIALIPESDFHRWDGRHDGLGLFFYKVNRPDPTPF